MDLIFEPRKWHTCSKSLWKTCKVASNCYSYALNKPEYYWAVPGMGYTKVAGENFLTAATKVFQKYSLSKFQAKLKTGAIDDDLIPTDFLSSKDGYYLVALFFSNQAGNLDFHWYRQDDDRTWSSKNGWQTPQRKDAKGNIIHDPRDIKDPDFPIFGGFYLTPKAGVSLKPSSFFV